MIAFGDARECTSAAAIQLDHLQLVAHEILPMTMDHDLVRCGSRAP